MINPSNVVNMNYDTGNAPENLVDGEDGEISNIVTFLNAETPELRLDFDSNDTSAQDIFTHYHTEDEFIS